MEQLGTVGADPHALKEAEPHKALTVSLRSYQKQVTPTFHFSSIQNYWCIEAKQKFIVRLFIIGVVVDAKQRAWRDHFIESDVGAAYL